MTIVPSFHRNRAPSITIVQNKSAPPNPELYQETKASGMYLRWWTCRRRLYRRPQRWYPWPHQAWARLYSKKPESLHTPTPMATKLNGTHQQQTQQPLGFEQRSQRENIWRWRELTERDRNRPFIGKEIRDSLPWKDFSLERERESTFFTRNQIFRCVRQASGFD